MTEPSFTAIDTSVAVPLLVASHADHAEVAGWAVGRALRLSGHAVHETYAVLTRLPGDARVSAGDAVRLIDENFPDPLVLSADSLRTVHRQLARSRIVGGATYDGLVALAALEHGCVLATRDARARPTYERLGVAVELLPPTPDHGIASV